MKYAIGLVEIIKQYAICKYKIHLNTISNGDLSDPICGSLKLIGLTLVRLSPLYTKNPRGKIFKPQFLYQTGDKKGYFFKFLLEHPYNDSFSLAEMFIARNRFVHVRYDPFVVERKTEKSSDN